MPILDKKKIGRMIPYPVIENGRRIIHAGPRRCKVCGSRIRRMADTGYGFDVLERLQVVGGLRRPADQCPICHSSSRERLIWFWMTEGGKGLRFPVGTRTAHFAPEKGLSKRLSSALAETYTAYDFEPSRYRHLDRVEQADLTKLQMEDGSVDLLICNHVVEHVFDVPQALGEICRVLSDDGVAVLQVPIALKLDATIELPVESTPQERIDLLGQDDHLRLFTQDGYVAALEQAGLKVELFDAFEADSGLATQWMLDPFEKLHLCRKR